jgi:apolipoprotein N-acyltransferase
VKRGAIGAAIASALMLWASSPAVGVGWLAWVALVPAAIVVLGNPGAGAARLAMPLTYGLYLELLLVPALPFGLAEGQWGDPPIPVLVGGSPVLVVALVAVPLAAALLYAIRFGEPWLAVRAGRAEAAACVLVPALAWAALDFVRVKVDPGGLFGPLFLSQADTAVGDLGALAGPWLITAVIVAVNYGLALALLRRRPLAAAAPAGAVAALAIVASLLAADAGRPAPGTGVRVAAIQPGYDTAEEDRAVLRRWEPGTYDLAALDLIGDLGRLTRVAVDRGAELVIWPEASIFVAPRAVPRVAVALRDLATASAVPLVVPYFAESESRSAALAVVPRPAGPQRAVAKLTASRPKQRPMWFLGEAGGGEPDPEPLAVPGWRVGTLLGLDAQDPGIAAALADAGADLLASSTHDWPALADQQRAFAKLTTRSVGAPLARADWRYGSAVYGRDGETLASAGTELRRTLVLAELAPGDPTPYARIGDAIGWVVLATAVTLGVAAALVASRARRPPGAARA